MDRLWKITRQKLNTLFWLFLAALFFILLLNETHFDIRFIGSRVCFPLLRLISVMAATLFLTAVIEAKGWSRIVAAISRPLMRLGNLGDWSATAFTTAFLSGIAANTMLWNAYKDGKISMKEMFLSALLNVGLPSYFLHLPITFAIIVPLAQEAGLLYMTITFMAAIIRTVFVIIVGRFLLERPETRPQTLSIAPSDGRKASVLELFKKYVTKRLTSIILYTVPIYMLVVLLRIYGIFNMLQQATAHMLKTNAIPVEGISVVVFSIVTEFSAGAAAAGAMLQEGVLTVKETVIALVLGNIIATPIRALRHQLPRYLGIYTPGTGLSLLLIGQALRVTSVIMATGIFLLVCHFM